MRRIYHHWEAWECCKAGMYETTPPNGLSRDEAVDMYREFLADIPRFKAAMRRVMDEWPISCEQFLSNENINRIAWLGQSSMCIETRVPCVYRAGFSRLDGEGQKKANSAAREYLDLWLSSRTDNGKTFTLEFGRADEDHEESRFSTGRKGIRHKIGIYCNHWRVRGYPDGIPDEVPSLLMQTNLAPSYKAIGLALLRNDMNLTSLGFAAPDSSWYGVLKKIEINSRPGNEPSQLEMVV